VISPSILARCKFPPKNWIPPKEFLLGVGQPWEPDPWDPCYDDPEEVDFIAASQQSNLRLILIPASLPLSTPLLLATCILALLGWFLSSCLQHFTVGCSRAAAVHG